MEFLRSSLRRHLAGKPVLASPNIDCFLRLVQMINGVFLHDVTMSTILVFQNKETAAMLVFQINPVQVQPFSYVKTFFCYNKFA